jgi:cysteinyl-tRNA synthetase
LLSTHYRSPMDWTAEKAAQARQTLLKWYRQVGLAKNDTQPYQPVVDALADDLNLHEAITECHALSNAGDFSALRGSLSVLGFMDQGVPSWASVKGFTDAETGLIRDLLQRRDLAKQSKDFAKADAIRDGLRQAGVAVKDIKTAEPEFERLPEFDVNQLDKLFGA